ncbi:MAG: DUF4199 domain-containing protein [Flavobacteriales bacterium]
MRHLSISATHGVYAGALQFILALATYLVNINLFVEWWYGLIGLGLSVFFMFSGTVAARKAGDGFMSFGQTWLHAMVVAVASSVVSVALTLVLYHVIAPELPEVLTKLNIDKSREFMEGMGMSGAMLDAAMKDAQASIEGAFTPGGMAVGALWGLTMWALVGLIVAAINKRNRPSEFA